MKHTMGDAFDKIKSRGERYDHLEEALRGCFLWSLLA